MTDRNDPDSIRDIEQGIARERAELADKIDHLRDAYSPDRLIRTARAHPVATAATGVGLAALIAGVAALSRKDRGDGGPALPDDGYAGSRASLPGAAHDADGPSVGEKLQSRAAQMRDRVHEGTEELSEAARARVHEARMKAIDAQHKVEREARRVAAEARDQAHEHPLVAGALALVIGAAVGAALPRTRTEDAALGRTRDRLLDEADRVLRQELRALREAGETALAEGRDTARDAVSVWARAPERR